jgi:hypothetical protein
LLLSLCGSRFVIGVALDLSVVDCHPSDLGADISR